MEGAFEEDEYDGDAGAGDADAELSYTDMVRLWRLVKCWGIWPTRMHI